MQAASGIEFQQSFQYYESAEGPNMKNNRSSGAYIFKTKNKNSKKIISEDELFVVKGISNMF